jgi:outer membrane protein
MSKVGIVLLLILGLALTPVWAGAAELKIGVVDAGNIMVSSSEGKKAQDAIKRKSEEVGKDLQRQDQEIGRMVEDFRKQQAVMKEDAKKRRQEEITQKGTELQKKASEAEKQLAQFREKELGPIFQKMDSAIKAVAAEEKLDLVLDKGNPSVLFVSPKLDITEKVRSRFGR